MLLELAGARPVDGPVPGLRPHRELRPGPATPRCSARPARRRARRPHRVRRPANANRQPRWPGRRQRFGVALITSTHAVTAAPFDHRSRRTLAERLTRHQRRQLARRSTRSSALTPSARHSRVKSRASASIACHPNAPAVVTPRTCLDHDQRRHVRRRRRIRVFDARAAGTATPAAARRCRMTSLSWAAPPRGDGVTLTPSATSFHHSFGTLVVSCQHVAPRRKAARSVCDDHVGVTCAGRVICHQYTEVLPQRDGSLMGSSGPADRHRPSQRGGNERGTAGRELATAIMVSRHSTGVLAGHGSQTVITR